MRAGRLSKGADSEQMSFFCGVRVVLGLSKSPGIIRKLMEEVFKTPPFMLLALLNQSMNPTDSS